jgi:hypothetical protein
MNPRLNVIADNNRTLIVYSCAPSREMPTPRKGPRNPAVPALIHAVGALHNRRSNGGDCSVDLGTEG